jgi:hypothetical protein
MAKKKKNKKSKPQQPLHGPGDDCECPVCVFSKSQAPGDAYLLEKCPKWSSKKKSDDK